MKNKAYSTSKIKITLNQWVLFTLCLLLGGIGLCLFEITDNNLYLSYSFCMQIAFVFFYVTKIHGFSLYAIYLIGFALFLGGGHLSNVLTHSESFCFDFGYYYCLGKYDEMKLFSLVYYSLLCSFVGYEVLKIKSVRLNSHAKFNKIVITLLFICFAFVMFYLIKSMLAKISLANLYGYLSLYSDQAGDSIKLPIELFFMGFCIATLSCFFSIKELYGSFFFKCSLLAFVIVSLISILTGSRGGITSMFFIIIWLKFAHKKFNYRYYIYTVVVMIGVIYGVNFLLTFTSRSAVEADFFELLGSVFSSQGITLMVFDLSSKTDGYPLLGYIKYIFPGSQYLLNMMNSVSLHEYSFPHYLTHFYAPNLYSQGYGFGWSFLGDLYVFSFGIIPIFLAFNFIFGMALKYIQSSNTFYMRGLSFCLASQIFVLSRASLSTVIMLVLMYSILYSLMKMRVKI